MIRICLCSPEPVLVRGLDSLLDSTEDFRLIGTCDRLEEFAGPAEAEQPDILLIDLTPEMNFQLIMDLRKRLPACRLVLWVREISTEIAYQAMALGIRGIVRRNLPLDATLHAFRNLHDGQMWFEKTLTDNILTARKVILTKREGQLVTMLSQGLKNKEMATMLCVSENTIKVYLSRLFQKVGVKDRFELALYGLRNVVAGQARLDQLIVHGESQRTTMRAAG